MNSKFKLGDVVRHNGLPEELVVVYVTGLFMICAYVAEMPVLPDTGDYHRLTRTRNGIVAGAFITGYDPDHWELVNVPTPIQTS